uniref:Uncharacterized protein n=1 Tax=Arundo donax TaxID=35708 RepID=A0A0A9GKT9_ARUDO
MSTAYNIKQHSLHCITCTMSNNIASTWFNSMHKKRL